MSNKTPVIFEPAMNAIRKFESDIAGHIATGLPMTEDTINKGWQAIQTIYAVGFRKRQTDADSYRLVLDRIGGQLADLEVAVKATKPVDPFMASLKAMTKTAMATAMAGDEGDE